ncbi:WD40-repeat-containing domain protein [Catenaria anguillulae PL171]|uniref:Elongator complex protein 2 n=1 Tax=Catenaria anguillulae PL171 TaxID=765915 RepID=A0A1Y2HL42_9FUNG|nr:WD40-repeat-containing domain protein [Catenaria anguillulae PL171]
MIQVTPTFLTAGCSRQPAGALWCKHSNHYFFASNKQILAATVTADKGLQVDPLASTYTGHTQPIRALAQLDSNRIVSVSADHTLRVWSTANNALVATLPVASSPAHVVAAHVFNNQAWIVAADTAGNVVAYTSSTLDSNAFTLAHQFTLRKYAVAAAMHIVTSPHSHAGGQQSQSALVLALSTADSLLHIYMLDAQPTNTFIKCLTLAGHENWVTALDFVTVPDAEWTKGAAGLHPGDVLLASGSMDKFIRIWRLTFWDSVLHPNMTKEEEQADQQQEQQGHDDDQDGNGTGKAQPAVVTDDNTDELLASMLASLQQDGQLSTKAHLVSFPPSSSTATTTPRHPPLHIYLDSILFGHDDWIHSLAWSPTLPLRLASASADKSVLIWSMLDGASWQTQARVGEMGGAVLSMHAVQWAPNGTHVAATGYSGAVHVWQELEQGEWRPVARAPSGHVGAVRDLLWDPLGQVVLSTSADQTTRVWARPMLEATLETAHGGRQWAEWARPQIHGYDLQALAFADPRTLVSAADEKVVRVFGVPLGFANAMARAGVVASPRVWGDEQDMVAVGANLPALGLSNKPVTAADTLKDKDANGAGEYLERQSYSATAASALAMLDGGNGADPPLEEHRLQQTLWPELDKLYGHGYECVAVAGSSVRGQVLTTCRATSAEHAVIRVYDSRTWQEVQVLSGAHALTVTAVKVAPRTGKWVVSAGRDRGWALWAWDQENDQWVLRQAKEKAHARIIWDVEWSGNDEAWFVTASRDKSAKVWRVSDAGEVALAATIPAPSAVMSVAVYAVGDAAAAYLAMGLESGVVQVMRCAQRSEGKGWEKVAELQAHTDAVNAVAWHKCEDAAASDLVELASGSEDGSVRVYEVSGCV